MVAVVVERFSNDTGLVWRRAEWRRWRLSVFSIPVVTARMACCGLLMFEGLPILVIALLVVLLMGLDKRRPRRAVAAWVSRKEYRVRAQPVPEVIETRPQPAPRMIDSWTAVEDNALAWMRYLRHRSSTGGRGCRRANRP